MKFKKFPGVRDVALPIRFECESYFVESFIKVSDRRQKGVAACLLLKTSNSCMALSLRSPCYRQDMAL